MVPKISSWFSGVRVRSWASASSVNLTKFLSYSLSLPIYKENGLRFFFLGLYPNSHHVIVKKKKKKSDTHRKGYEMQGTLNAR